MNETTKAILGAAAAIIALGGYVPYFRDIFSGKTKPHAFSWLIWASLQGIGFAGQISDSAGPGAWITGITAVACMCIFVLAIFRGEKNITPSDWVCLLSAGMAIPLWLATSTPLWSVILISVIDVIGFVPTYRKSYSRPFDETGITYTVSGFTFIISIVALQNYSVITVLYPATLVVANLVFALMLYARRRKLGKPREA